MKRDEACLRWRCRRGMREVELLLEAYLDENHGALPEGERRVFDRLLDCPDPELMAYFYGHAIPVDKEMARLVAKIRNSLS